MQANKVRITVAQIMTETSALISCAMCVALTYEIVVVVVVVVVVVASVMTLQIFLKSTTLLN